MRSYAVQLDLFRPPPAPSSSSAPTTASSALSPIVGLRVQLQQACICGSYLGVIGSSAGPHANRVVCDSCNVFRRWLGHREANFIAAISAKFGCPSSPVVLRTREDV
jgi:hypothetical protein